MPKDLQPRLHAIHIKLSIPSSGLDPLNQHDLVAQLEFCSSSPFQLCRFPIIYTSTPMRKTDQHKTYNHSSNSTLITTFIKKKRKEKELNKLITIYFVQIF